MVSYAAKGGGIGPHVDNYDVFLVQAAGSRRWRFSSRKLAVAEERLIPNISVSVLDGGFDVEFDVTLFAGDVLYIPPRCPHWGIAEQDDSCLTYSVGFRAPRYSELLLGFADHVTDLVASNAHPRYKDGQSKAGAAQQADFYRDDARDLQLNFTEPGRITKDVIARARAEMLQLLQSTADNGDEHNDLFLRWFGQAVSEPKRFRQGNEFSSYMLSDIEAEKLSEALVSSMNAGSHRFGSAATESVELRVAEAVVVAYVDCADSNVLVYVNGVEYQLGQWARPLVSRLSWVARTGSPFELSDLVSTDDIGSDESRERNSELGAFLKWLLTQGMLIVVEDDSSDEDF